MRTLLISGIAAAGALALCGPALAHHSFSMFDATKTVTLDGTVMQFEFTNPHSWLEVATLDNKHWSLELNNLVGLRRYGWRAGTLKPGDKVKVVMHPMRDGTAAGQLMLVTAPDGTVWSGQGPLPPGANGGAAGAAARGAD